MARRYPLASGFIVVAAFSMACSPKFTTCEDAGVACSAGTSGSGNSGHGHDKGGNSGKSGQSGDGGTSERGEGGERDEVPKLFDACSVKGALACKDHASAQRFTCDGYRWQAGTTCPVSQLCNPSDGSCLPVVSECASVMPGARVCRGDQVLTCGPDLLTAGETELCVGRCKEGVCQAPICGDEKVEAGEECDNDAKRSPGDGCSASCRAEPVALALGGDTTCALSSTGLVKCWGFNGTGELGLGHIENRGGATVPRQFASVDLGSGRKATAISVSSDGSTCAVLEGGDLKCWGNNLYGQLGTGDSQNRGDEPKQMGDALKPIALGAGRKAVSVSAASGYTCALLDDGTVKCWGDNSVGQLGTETAGNLQAPDPVASVKLGRKAKAVSASADGVTCALLDDGTVKCWGNVSYVTHADYAELGGAPGIGDFIGEISALPRLTFSGGAPAQSVIAGHVSAVLLGDGSLRIWGTTSDGQFGRGLSYLGLTPSELAVVQPVAIGTGRAAKGVALGATHACVLLDNGQVKCWAGNNEGQLGLGNVSAINGPPGVIDAVYLGGHSALQIAAGKNHSCAILDEGSLRCWGSNSAGQLGLGDLQNRGDSGGKLSADTTVDLTF